MCACVNGKEEEEEEEEEQEERVVEKKETQRENSFSLSHVNPASSPTFPPSPPPTPWWSCGTHQKRMGHHACLWQLPKDLSLFLLLRRRLQQSPVVSNQRLTHWYSRHSIFGTLNLGKLLSIFGNFFFWTWHFLIKANSL